MSNLMVERLIKLAIEEDIGDGDHTSLACVPGNAAGTMKLLIKDVGILAGVEIAKEVFYAIDKSIVIDVILKDGTKIKPGDIAFYVKGKLLSLLRAERLVLNIMQRMSGIATVTNLYVYQLKGLKTKVLDTRKTNPGMRVLDKMAVTIGGGENHRIGLFDMILIKDNHIDFAGGINNAIMSTLAYLKKNNKKLKIEIEARTIDDVQVIIKTGNIDRIMLDNFSINVTKEAVNLVNGKFETESSGGITFENIRNYALCGVDYISVGALTHHVSSLDMSLKASNF